MAATTEQDQENNKSEQPSLKELQQEFFVFIQDSDDYSVTTDDINKALEPFNGDLNFTREDDKNTPFSWVTYYAEKLEEGTAGKTLERLAELNPKALTTKNKAGLSPIWLAFDYQEEDQILHVLDLLIKHNKATDAINEVNDDNTLLDSVAGSEDYATLEDKLKQHGALTYEELQAQEEAAAADKASESEEAASA